MLFVAVWTLLLRWRSLLTSADGRFCACTVPSLHLSRRARFSAPPLLLLHLFRSYWPRLQSTVGPPGTGKKIGIKLAKKTKKNISQSFPDCVAMEMTEQ